MLNFFQNLKKNYLLDGYVFILFATVSFSTLQNSQITIPILVILSVIQFYRLIKNKVSIEYGLKTFFYLLIYSLIFFRSAHTFLLIINILLYGYFFFKTKKFRRKGNHQTEIIIVVFFGLIFLNHIVFSSKLRGLDTYLYILFYPILFYFIKSSNAKISKIKALKVFITSVLVASVILFFVNLYNHKISLTTNTFFAEYLGLTHVYFGIFLGVSCVFLLQIKNDNKTFISKYVDVITFFIILFMLIHIGARMSLLAVFLVLGLSLYKRVPLKWHYKGLLLLMVFIGALALSYKTVPRVRNDIRQIQKVYHSVNTNDKQDLLENSWRNMYQRFLVTKYTLKLIKTDLFFGKGLQNVKGKVSEQILKDGYKYFQPINPHNQYLHILLGMGLLSFLFFLWMLFQFYKEQPIASYFLIYFLIILLTESALVRVKGISVFFIFTLLFSMKNNLKND